MTSMPEPKPETVETQRLDKWLWFARVAKTRTLASSLVDSGKIRVNKVKVTKPSHSIRPGDVITATVARTVRIYKVCEIGVRRGPATQARMLYEDLTPAPDAIMSQAPGVVKSEPGGAIARIEGSAAIREAGSGRPTKRDRRQIDRLRKSIDDH